MKAILTPEQSRAARRALGLTQNQLIEQSQLSGYKLKQFESGFADPEGVAPFLRELRDFFESEGHEFADAPEAANDPQPGEQVRVVRDAVVVCDQLTHSQRGAIQDRVRELLAGLQEGLRKKTVEGLIDPYDDETDLARDRAITVFAEIGVLYTALFGGCPLKSPSETILKTPRKAKNISDVLSIRFAEALKLTSDSDPNSRSENSGEGASGGGSDVPALDGDGQKATTSPAAPKKKGALKELLEG